MSPRLSDEDFIDVCRDVLKKSDSLCMTAGDIRRILKSYYQIDYADDRYFSGRCRKLLADCDWCEMSWAGNARIYAYKGDAIEQATDNGNL